ncbi:hypothetical protein AMATHDRAFT_6187 [Amanita thiersii Skay4041]|uniref:Uncharacterized protein n=1 Tax=Amanita thiersii Skay4041 TaxID=703135 RepID=A0A2A9NAK7_9AGAR|nr:hypothetical protein AMATHDRAFT_6187 [Amanita thiersii Skay4041]
MSLANYSKTVSDIVEDLKNKEDNAWELKILKDIKNKGLQAKVLEVHPLQNPSILQEKKSTLKTIIKDAEKWQPKNRVDDDGSFLPDSPPPSPVPKPKTKPLKKNVDARKAAELSRKGNTPNTRRLQTLLNEMNVDNGKKIMKEIHKISNMDKISDAKKQLVKDKPTNENPSYAQTVASKNPKNQKDPCKDGVGGWKTVGRNNKISQPTILPPPPNVFKFFVTDDENTLPAKKQNEEELTTSLNSIISKNVEWLLILGSNHVKSANWSKDPKAIIVTMVWNINKNRTDDLPDGKAAYDTLQEVVMDLFPGATLANRKPRSKLKFMRVLTQHSDGLPMDNGLLYHYIRKHPNFKNVHFSLTLRFECPRPPKPGQTPRPEYTKTVICKVFDMETGAVTKKCLGSTVWSNSTVTPAPAKSSSSDHSKIRKIA